MRLRLVFLALLALAAPLLGQGPEGATLFNDEGSEELLKYKGPEENHKEEAVEENHKEEAVEELFKEEALEEEKYSMEWKAMEVEPRGTFGYLTPYALSRGNFSKSEVAPEGCIVKYVSMITRNGVATPDLYMTLNLGMKLPALKHRIIKAHKDGQGNLSKLNISLLRTWTREPLSYLKRSITREGHKEMRGLGSRFARQFPNLANGSKVKMTARLGYPHIYDSALSFSEGLLGNKCENIETSRRNTHFRFPSFCYEYMKTYTSNLKARNAFMKYGNSVAIRGVLESVVYRTGISLDIDDIYMLYLGCAFWRGYEPKWVSPFCVVFSETDLEKLEYFLELESYNCCGYRYNITQHVACPAMKEILSSLKSAIDNEQEGAEFYFAGNGIIPMMLTYLGLFKDKSLPEEEYFPDRQWRSARFSGFGSNIAFFLSKCSDVVSQSRGTVMYDGPPASVSQNATSTTNITESTTPESNPDDRWWVSATLNEKPLFLPACDTDSGCPFNDFIRNSSKITKCNFKEICHNSGSLGVFDRSSFWGLWLSMNRVHA